MHRLTLAARTFLLGLALLPLTSCTQLSGIGDMLAENSTGVIPGLLRSSQVGDQECLYGTWDFVSSTNPNLPQGFSSGTMEFSERHVITRVPYADLAAEYRMTRDVFGRASVETFNAELLDDRVPTGFLGQPRGTGRAEMIELTNNVFKANDGRYTSVFRKRVPTRNYVVVHAREPIVSELSPGHLFVQLSRKEPGQDAFSSHEVYGYYPARLDKASYLRWDEIATIVPGSVRDEINDVELQQAGHRYYSIATSG